MRDTQWKTCNDKNCGNFKRHCKTFETRLNNLMQTWQFCACVDDVFDVWKEFYKRLNFEYNHVFDVW